MNDDQGENVVRFAANVFVNRNNQDTVMKIVNESQQKSKFLYMVY